MTYNWKYVLIQQSGDYISAHFSFLRDDMYFLTSSMLAGEKKKDSL